MKYFISRRHRETGLIEGMSFGQTIAFDSRIEAQMHVDSLDEEEMQGWDVKITEYDGVKPVPKPSEVWPKN